MTESEFAHTVTVEPQEQDIDHMGHVNNSVYLTWVQEVVVGHWSRIAPPDIKAQVGWIALKHEIIYRRAAFLGEAVDVGTRIVQIRGVKAYYETLIKRGEKVLASVKSVWGAVDLSTGRLKRLKPQDIETIFPGGFGRTELGASVE